eukprot:457685-Amphidinium_carterae.2
MSKDVWWSQRLQGNVHMELLIGALAVHCFAAKQAQTCGISTNDLPHLLSAGLELSFARVRVAGY